MNIFTANMHLDHYVWECNDIEDIMKSSYSCMIQFEKKMLLCYANMLRKTETVKPKPLNRYIYVQEVSREVSLTRSVSGIRDLRSKITDPIYPSCFDSSNKLALQPFALLASLLQPSTIIKFKEISHKFRQQNLLKAYLHDIIFRFFSWM